MNNKRESILKENNNNSDRRRVRKYASQGEINIGKQDKTIGQKIQEQQQ